MKKLFGYTACLLFLALAPFEAFAQSSNPAKTEKLFLNIHLNADRLKVEDGDGVGGGGLGIKAGYGFSRLFTLYLGIDGASMNAGNFPGDNNNEDEKFAMALVELGGQFNFKTAKPAAVPYAEVALSAQAIQFDPDQIADITFTGGGLSLGGGLKYFVSTTLALDLGLSLTFGNFNEVEFANQTAEIDQNSVITRLNFGLSWFPFNR